VKWKGESRIQKGIEKYVLIFLDGERVGGGRERESLANLRSRVRGDLLCFDSI
jgi:hypothetical protein